MQGNSVKKDDIVTVLINHLFFITLAMLMVFSTKLNAYTVVSSKTEVSPGCEGGISSEETTSVMIDDVNESKTLETDPSANQED